MIIFVIAVVGVGALITLAGARLIERVHPPRGRFVEIGGCRQHVLELGPAAATPSAVPVVLLHGAGCNLEDMYVALGERLAARHRVILVDRPGQGWSARRHGEGHLPSYQAAVLRELLDRLGVERVILVGHSWGGAVALSFALDYPQRAAGLVLLATPTHPRLNPMMGVYRLLALPVIGRVFAHTLALPLAAPALGPGVRGSFLPQVPPRRYLARAAAFLLLRPAVFLANARDMAGLEGFLAPQVPRYAKLAVPTVIVAGDRDLVVPLRHHAQALAAAVPRARLVVLPGLGHMLHHAAADRVATEVEELAISAAGG
jgi:pimeloyl-ACP methyl ester carboxylesterase